MNLASSLLQQLTNPSLSPDERAQLRCELAKEMEDAGNYESAREVLESLWQRVGERPRLEGLDRQTAAQVLLRAGSLTGWIGSARQIEGAQEIAKDLISESIAIFEELGEVEKACDAQVDLAICYWREGAFDEARVMLNSVITSSAGRWPAPERRAYLNLGVVERTANRYHDALRILTGAAPLFEASDNHAQRGRFHNQLGTVLKHLGAAERRSDYTDRALVEYAAASFHFGEAGNLRFRAAVENNLGFLFLMNQRYREAHEHLEHARRLFVGLKDKVHTAQVDETLARAFLAEHKYVEAERVARGAVRTLEEGGEQALLAEALTTWGAALARLERSAEARAALEKAVDVASQVGDNEGAGVAALTLLEELGEQVAREERLRLYARADELLSQSQHAGILARLRAAARKVITPHEAEEHPPSKQRWPNFVYASEEMAGILKRTHRIATTSHPLLITGETGTGKELLARLVHQWSGRTGELVIVNCAALAEGFLESELFGHKQGSFAYASADHAGFVRQAAGGTLLLDEVTELSPGALAKLLRLIEHGEIQTIGEPVPDYVNVRVIVATSHDLRQRVAKGSFREDLFYRLQAFHVELPPLRERPEDVEALAKHFISEALKEAPRRVTFTPEAIQAMRALPLEGNARQLRSLIEHTLVTAADGAVITAEAVEVAGLRSASRAGFSNPWEGFSLKEEVRRFESRFIELALKESKGRVSQAARLLGFKHHESLTSLLTNKHKELLEARTPPTPRRRSIIPRDKLKRGKSANA